MIILDYSYPNYRNLFVNTPACVWLYTLLLSIRNLELTSLHFAATMGLLWNLPLKPRTDTGFRIKNWGVETIVLCASCGCRKGDRVLTPGWGRSSIRRYSSYGKAGVFRGQPRHFVLILPKIVPPQTRTVVDHYHSIGC